MAAPELYAPRRPVTGRARTGRETINETARRRGLVYRALTSGVTITVLGGFGYYAWTAYNGERTPIATDGEVAVIAASADPLKTPPDNPGGIAVQGSDYEFFASVDGERLDIRPDEEFVLPPPEAPITEPSPEIFDRPPPVPVELAGDGAAANALEDAVYEVADAIPIPVAVPGVSVPPVIANPMLPLPVVEQGQLTAEPTSQATGTTVPAAQSAIDTLVASLANEGGATPRFTVAAEPAVAEPAQQPVATAASGASVQLASMLSQELAEEEWSRLTRLMPDLLANRQPIIRVSSSNDRTYYRVSVAARDGADAAALCAEIKNRSLDCIVHN